MHQCDNEGPIGDTAAFAVIDQVFEDHPLRSYSETSSLTSLYVWVKECNQSDES